MKSLKSLSWVFLLAGLAGLTGLIAWQGAGEIGAIIVRGGWAMLLLALFVIPQVVLFTISWRFLFPAGRAPGFTRAASAMTVGMYANTLLPVAEIGGEVIKARIVMKGGVSGRDAGASVVLDKTIQTLSLIAWALIGLAALVYLNANGPVIIGGLAGIALLTAGTVGFIIVQHKGMFGPMARFGARLTGGDKWAKLAGGAGALDDAVRALYRHRGRLAAAAAIRLLGRVMLIGEVWLAAQLIGHPIGPIEALALRSLSLTLRSAAFMLPGGYGVQEGGYIAIGALIGVPPDIALVLSLASRLRDFVVGVPALAAWQFSEGRGMAKARRPAPRSEPSRATDGDG
ncbi:MAG: flippase-like domain-containing protein [Alphaproteobacteria bacterium]